MGKSRGSCCLTPPLLRFCLFFFLAVGCVFRRASSRLIKIAAAQPSRTRRFRIHERPEPSISYPINCQPFDVVLPPTLLVHEIKRDTMRSDSFPLVRSTTCILSRRRFPSSVLRHLLTILEPPSATEPHLTRCFDFLHVSVLFKVVVCFS